MYIGATSSRNLRYACEYLWWKLSRAERILPLNFFWNLKICEEIWRSSQWKIYDAIRELVIEIEITMEIWIEPICDGNREYEDIWADPMNIYEANLGQECLWIYEWNRVE
jgi:hypothetical protein